MPKEAYLSLRITRQEKDFLEEAARVLDLSQTEVVRVHGVEKGVAIGKRSIESAAERADAA